MNRPFSFAFAAFALMSAPALAEPVNYAIDTGHSEVVFTYSHLGFSTNYGAFSQITGTISFDAENPAASSVEATFPVSSLQTGAAARSEHFLTPDFFNAAVNETVTFKSTSVEVTGDKTANITGDLTLNGVTKPVVLETTLNQAGEHPMEKKNWIGLTATTKLVRSEFNLGLFAPAIPDEVDLSINIEAGQAN